MKKVIIFGILGAVGCLAAAWGIGEPLWKYLTPPPPTPQLRITASPSVTLEQGETNKFVVMVARQNFEGPVTVRCSSQPPSGIQINQVTLAPSQTEQEIVVSSQDTALAGQHRIEITATSPVSMVSAKTELTLQVNAVPRTRVDVLFVLDVTNSMQWAIDGVRQGILAFARELDKPRLDARVGVLAYRDDLNNEPAKVLDFNGYTFTNDYGLLSREVGTLTAQGGGDTPESTLDALALAAGQNFREGTTRVILLITDAPPHIPDARVVNVDQAIGILRRGGVNQIHLVVHQVDRAVYAPLQTAFEGQFFDISNAASSGNAFASILPGISREIARTTIASQPPAAPKVSGVRPAIQAIQSNKQFAAESSYQLLLMIGAWTAILAFGVSFALIIAQNIYLHRAPLGIAEAFKGLAGSLTAGALAGVAGQLLFAPLSSLPAGIWVARIAGWALLGMLLGGGLSFFVPNLALWRGLLGGCLGGVLGSIGFFYITQAKGESAGRVAGAALLGACIGLMVALVEMLFREAWLEIRYGSKEIRNVSLGGEPIAIGSNQNMCTVYAANAAPVAYRYWLKESSVFCEDVPAKRTGTVLPGDRKQIGNLVAMVCSARGAIAAAKGEGSTKPRAESPRKAAFVLRLSNGESVDLATGATLTAADLPGLHSVPPGGPVGRVNPHPSDPNVQGLQNVSHLPWRVGLPNGDSIEVKPGKNVRLAVGTRINFGQIEGKIEA